MVLYVDFCLINFVVLFVEVGRERKYKEHMEGGRTWEELEEGKGHDQDVLMKKQYQCAQRGR